PVRGGTIFFDSEDTRRSEGMSAPIDETGHFDCDPEWRRDPTGRSRFRISVVLDRREYPPDRPSARRGDGPAADGIVGAAPVPSGEARPVETVLRAPMGTPERVSPSLINEPARQPALSPNRSTGLEIELGPEPAQLTIEWKD